MNKFNDSFEELDKDLQKTFRAHQETRVPEEWLKDFDAQVKRRILDSKGPASPFGIGLGIFAVSLAAAGLIAFLFLKSNVPAPQPVPALPPETVQMIPTEQAVPVPLHKKIPPAEISSTEEIDLLTEIAALQELGLWTDADDEMIGISAEQTLSELELALEPENLSLQSNPQFSV